MTETDSWLIIAELTGVAALLMAWGVFQVRRRAREVNERPSNPPITPAE